MQPTQQVAADGPVIKIQGTKLNNVQEFTYLGSCGTSDCSLNKEISSRLAKGSPSFGRQWRRVWTERGIKLSTKIAVYRAVVLTSLLYGFETWTPYRRHIRLLDQFQLHCLRKIMGIKWQDRITNTEVLEWANISGIEALLIKSRLRWTGHVMRITNDRISKQLFLSELSTSTRAQGAPLKRYKDAVKSSLKACSIPVMGWEALTLDHTSWRKAVSQGYQMFETRRVGDLARKRQDRKEQQRTASKYVACPAWGQICASEFRLRSHQRRH